MRKVVFGSFMLILALSALQTGQVSASHILVQINAQSKVAVRPEDLPEAVKSTLASDDYADWKVTNAYLVTRENSTQYFEVNLKKGEESLTVNIDKYGRKVD